MKNPTGKPERALSKEEVSGHPRIIYYLGGGEDQFD